MTDPFDLPGPQFLQLFGVLLAAATIGATLVRWSVSRSDATADAALDSYETAYLAGGRQRVVLLAVSNLLRMEAVKFDTARRHITSTGNALARLAPLERRLAARAGGPLSMRETRLALADDMTQIVHTLQAQDLLVSDEGVWLTRATTVGLFGITVLVGFIKICVGISRDRPVGFLVILCLIAAVLTIPLLNAPVRTAAGRRLLRGRRLKNPKPYVRAKDYDVAVALWGVDGLYGHPDAADLRRCFAMNTGSGDGGGSGSGCGGSSCGGGGGGGGCGGCGGGGH